MKISELITKLNYIKDKQGDLNVHITDMMTGEALVSDANCFDGAVVIHSVNDEVGF